MASHSREPSREVATAKATNALVRAAAASRLINSIRTGSHGLPRKFAHGYMLSSLRDFQNAVFHRLLFSRFFAFFVARATGVIVLHQPAAQAREFSVSQSNQLLQGQFPRWRFGLVAPARVWSLLTPVALMTHLM